MLISVFRNDWSIRFLEEDVTKTSWHVSHHPARASKEMGRCMHRPMARLTAVATGSVGAIHQQKRVQVFGGIVTLLQNACDEGAASVVRRISLGTPPHVRATSYTKSGRIRRKISPFLIPRRLGFRPQASVCMTGLRSRLTPTFHYDEVEAG
jgi:hypothetical protein